MLRIPAFHVSPLYSSYLLVLQYGGGGGGFTGTVTSDAGGNGTTNTLAYSYDGVSWTGLGKTIFTSACNGIATNGSLWVAGGSGGNGLAYSYDGITWTGLGTTLFSQGQTVAWGVVNGTGMWVDTALGGTYGIAYSYDGISWIGAVVVSSFTGWRPTARCG
jgi:hypothetical protein